MPTQDTTKIKESIISFLKTNGPSLPVHIANKIETSILFTSAFLSELLSEKRLKISHMRVGSSPLYFLEGQEPQLEKFSQYLRSKEKEAFLLLKEKKILKDAVQHPAIRVALREIRDFAIPFKKDDEIYWRYFTSEEKVPEKETHEEKPQKEIKGESGAEKPKEEVKQAEKTKTSESGLDIFDKEEKPKPKKKKSRKSTKKKSKSGEKLFNDVKEFMKRNAIELEDVSSFSKSEIVLLVRESGTKKILIAFNKNKISEKDLSKANKKAQEFNLPYIAIGKSGVLKKIETLIEDLKNMDSVKSLSD